jgi:NADP-dependent 3-hydroxy acid dehydrogenase YdfG
MADRILITGCSSGIGKAAAQQLGAAGHTVYATARKPENLAGLAEFGCTTLALDVDDEKSMIATVREVGPVDVLVNNAGYGLYGPVEQVGIEDVRRQFETNVFGLTRLTQLVLPAMREQQRGLPGQKRRWITRMPFPTIRTTRTPDTRRPSPTRSNAGTQVRWPGCRSAPTTSRR